MLMGTQIAVGGGHAAVPVTDPSNGNRGAVEGEVAIHEVFIIVVRMRNSNS